MSDAEAPRGTTEQHVVEGVVTRLSPWSVEDTVARLSAVLAAKGVKVFTVIDHSAEAAAVGLSLRPTKLVIFGSPRAGTPVMQAAPQAALDLPLKVVVWDDGGETKVSYTDPVALAERYHLEAGLAERIGGVPAIVDALLGR